MLYIENFCVKLFLVKQLDRTLRSFYMGFPTKVQVIKRKDSEQWYINFPSAVAQICEFEKGEIVEWTITDKNNLCLYRKDNASKESPVKKKR